jgi:hypothetical protein
MRFIFYSLATDVCIFGHDGHFAIPQNRGDFSPPLFKYCHAPTFMEVIIIPSNAAMTAQTVAVSSKKALMMMSNAFAGKEIAQAMGFSLWAVHGPSKTSLSV